MLSHGERLALVCHVLSAISVHLLSVVAHNATILKKANRVIKDFLWHGRKDVIAGPTNYCRV